MNWYYHTNLNFNRHRLASNLIPEKTKKKALKPRAFKAFWLRGQDLMTCKISRFGGISARTQAFLLRASQSTHVIEKQKQPPYGDCFHFWLRGWDLHLMALPNFLRKFRLRSPRGSDSPPDCHSIPLGRSLRSLPPSYSPFVLITRRPRNTTPPHEIKKKR